MLIQNGILLEPMSCTFKTFENKEFKVYLHGVIFTVRQENEEGSLSEILNYFRENKSIDFPSIRGNFFLYILNLRTNEACAFIDNSGMYKIFRYKNIISTSFLELIDFIGPSSFSLNFRAISEFFHFGFVSFNDTFLNEVKKVEANDLIVWQGQDLIVKHKHLDELTASSNVGSFAHYFCSLKKVLQGKKISVDLTGGIDSRLICCMLHSIGVDFEVACSSGSGQETQDLRIAKIVAGMLGKELHVTFTSAANVTKKGLLEIFELTDAQMDILNYYPAYQLSIDRKSRGVDLQLSGVGGELYKDQRWYQDFPFYKKKNSNLDRLYDLRIESISFPHDLLGDKVKAHSLNTKLELMKKLERCKMPFNTQTYDSIYYYYNLAGIAGTFVTIANNHFFSAYAPYPERELVKIGFNLNRTERLFNNFHRKHMSKCSSNIAKIKTTENISCSTENIELIKDVFGFILDKSKRLAKQVLRKITNQTYFQESNAPIEIYDEIKKMEIFKQQGTVLKDFQVLSNDINIIHLPNYLLGRALTVGLFLNKLSK